MIKFLLRHTLLIIFSIMVPIMFSVDAGAVPNFISYNECITPGIPTYTASLQAPKGEYTVYARWGARGEQADIRSFGGMQNQSDGCQLVGSATISSNEWTKIGTIASSDSDQPLVLQLQSSQLSEEPDANRPSYMLVPNTTSICSVASECFVTIHGETGYVRPPTVSPDRNSMYAVRVVDPKTDTIQNVRYFVDNALIYEKSTLEQIDQNFVWYPGQKITRIISYKSGQNVVFDTFASDTTSDSFFKYIYRLQHKSPTFFAIAIVSVVLGVFALVLRAIVKILQKRHDYKVHHGLIRDNLSILLDIYYRISSSTPYKIFRYVGIAVTSIVILLIGLLLVNNYVARIFFVNGDSMQNGLKTGDAMLINSIPKAAAAINGREYIPQRGEVVIVRNIFGNANQQDESSTDTYLIKRVLGLPGERITVRDGAVTVYNATNPNGIQPDKASSWEKTMIPDVSKKTLTIQLGPSEIFVSGDNRPISLDSRLNGPIAAKEIVGVVVGRLWEGKK